MDPDAEATHFETIDQDEIVEDQPVGMYQVWMLAFSLAILQIGFGIVD